MLESGFCFVVEKKTPVSIWPIVFLSTKNLEKEGNPRNSFDDKKPGEGR
jgi:hypothetical protein